MMKMCQAMAMEGHDVRLIVPRYERMEKGHSNAAGFGEDYGISCRFPVLELGRKSVLSRVRFQYEAMRRSRGCGADLIYTRDVSTAALTSLSGIPTYLEVHQVPGGRVGPWYFRAALAGSGFRRLIVITQGLQHLLTEHHGRCLKGKSVIVAPDGVDLERFARLPVVADAAKELGADPLRFRVGYTGNLYGGRGIELILELAKSFRDVEFWIIGGRPADVEHWRARARSFDIRNTKFWGYVPNALLPKYQAACHVLLMPFERQVAVSGGRGDTSAVMSPMKMFEYMATGRLIISSDLPVLREVLSDRNAALCPPDDVGAWIQALERARDDAVWRESRGAQAREDVQSYSWDRRVQRIFGSNI